MAQSKSFIQLQKRLRLAASAMRPLQTAKPRVAITGVTARAVREPVSRTSYVIVTIMTDAGVTGVGETTAHPDPRTAVARILRQKPRLVGQDALAAETVRRALALSTDASAGELAPVQAAVNMALLDILGKISKAPVYELLGGPTRRKARAFAHLHGESEEALRSSLDRARSAGYRAFLAPLKLPEGPTRGRAFYRQTYRRLEALRKAAGDDSDFILDCGGRLAPSEAAGLAAEFERFHLLWLDEPISDISHTAVAKISAESATPVGLGRTLSGNSGFQDLLRMDGVDVLRPDLARLGISQIRKAAALAETYYVAVAPFHRAGPIGTVAGIHAAASMPNFFIQEVPLPMDERDRAMRREIAGGEFEKPEDGFLPLPARDGLGVSLNEEAVHAYEAGG